MTVYTDFRNAATLVEARLLEAECREPQLGHIRGRLVIWDQKAVTLSDKIVRLFVTTLYYGTLRALGILSLNVGEVVTRAESFIEAKIREHYLPTLQGLEGQIAEKRAALETASQELASKNQELRECIDAKIRTLGEQAEASHTIGKLREEIATLEARRTALAPHSAEATKLVLTEALDAARRRAIQPRSHTPPTAIPRPVVPLARRNSFHGEKSPAKGARK